LGCGVAAGLVVFRDTVLLGPPAVAFAEDSFGAAVAFAGLSVPGARDGADWGEDVLPLVGASGAGVVVGGASDPAPVVDGIKPVDVGCAAELLTRVVSVVDGGAPVVDGRAVVVGGAPVVVGGGSSQRNCSDEKRS
jgi:hypothetical protein